MAGDGRQQLSAWAGPGDGVLVYDPSGSEQVTQQDQVVLTDWDPTASTDLQAVRDVFDTNHDGSLDAGDAAFNDFKVDVTESDGAHRLESLGQLGITSIGLTSNNQEVAEPDGSAITGETTFTRADGASGTVADAVLAYTGETLAAPQVVTRGPDGSRTVESRTTQPDGTPGEITSTTAADGSTVSLAYAGAGGSVERRQVDRTVAGADGGTTATVTDLDGTGTRVTGGSVTRTSGDGRNVEILRDTDGSGAPDQVESRHTAADGSLTVSSADLAPDGSVRNGSTTVTSADGLSKTTVADGAGGAELVRTDDTAVGADGMRTETVTDYAGSGGAAGRELGQTVSTASPDGADKTSVTKDGDGHLESATASRLVADPDGSSTSILTDYGADGGVRSREEVNVAADGHASTVDLPGGAGTDGGRRPGTSTPTGDRDHPADGGASRGWQGMFERMSGALGEVDHYAYNAGNAPNLAHGAAPAAPALYDPQASAEVGVHQVGAEGHDGGAAELAQHVDAASGADDAFKDGTPGFDRKAMPH